jgi:hypothetical protein
MSEANWKVGDCIDNSPRAHRTPTRLELGRVYRVTEVMILSKSVSC